MQAHVRAEVCQISPHTEDEPDWTEAQCYEFEQEYLPLKAWPQHATWNHTLIGCSGALGDFEKSVNHHRHSTVFDSFFERIPDLDVEQILELDASAEVLDCKLPSVCDCCHDPTVLMVSLPDDYQPCSGALKAPRSVDLCVRRPRDYGQHRRDDQEGGKGVLADLGRGTEPEMDLLG